MPEIEPANRRPRVPGRGTRFLGAVSGPGLCAVFVWGASFAATRVALDCLNPFGLVALRAVAGTLLLAAILHARRGRLLPIRHDLPACIFLGGVLSAHLLIQAYGLQRTTAIHAGWIIGFIPVTLALGAWLVGQQRLHGLGWLGVALGTGGVLVVTGAKPPDFAQARFGDLLQLVSCVTWTVYSLAVAGPTVRNGVLCVTTCSMGVAAVITGVGAAGAGVLHGPFTIDTLLVLIFLGPICSGVAYYLWFAAVDAHGPARTGALLYLEPFVALLTGALLLGEPVSLWAILGGLCVLAGVWLVAKGSAKRA